MMARHTRTFGLAAALLIHCAGASAADTSWTGGAGPSQSFWDLAANWSPGPPLSATTRALLGSFDTTLRSGAFEVDTLQGSGTLTMTGGTLSIAGNGSTLGRLNLRGGNLLGAGDLTVGQLVWGGGALGEPSSGTNALGLVVTGTASISGNVTVGDSTPSGRFVRLQGETTWQDGASTIAFAIVGYLQNDASGVFHDHAATGPHTLGSIQSGLLNYGSYEKTGAATTLMAGLSNGGTMTVRDGLLRVQDGAGGNWSNSGTFNVDGGRAEVDMFRGSIGNSGTVNVNAGEMAVRSIGSGLSTTGAWNVAAGAVLSFDAGWGSAPWLFPFTIDGGTLNNAGTLRFTGANMQITFASAATLTGSGVVELLEGAGLVYPGSLDIGGLRLGPAFTMQDTTGFYGYALNSASVGGSLTVGRLDWGDGPLVVGGPVTVNGPATLTEDIEKTSQVGSSSGPPEPGKRMDVPFRFNSGVTWDGRSDIYGSGSMAIAAGTTFEDHNSRGTVDYYGTPRTTRILVAGGVANAGTYLKTGPAPTVITSAFTNAGSVRAVDAGTLTFAGALDNTGTLEAVRSRIVVFGTLAQAAEESLSGGRYVMRDGRIVLNLGANAGGTGPALIVTNAAHIELDGPQAQLVTTWLGSDVNALAGLRFNQGRLAVLNGAVVEPTGDFVNNSGLVEIAGGGRLSVKLRPFTFYSQSFSGGDPNAVATWVDGTLEAGSITFTDGRFGAGGATSIGLAKLLGDVSFGSSRFDVDVTDHAHFDLVAITGDVSLGGVLVVDFAGTPELGSYRILTADAVGGSFGTLQSNLDPARYRVDALYGASYVDLSVTAVPEPTSLALMIGGLLGLGLRARATRRNA